MIELSGIQQEQKMRAKNTLSNKERQIKRLWYHLPNLILLFYFLFFLNHVWDTGLICHLHSTVYYIQKRIILTEVSCYAIPPTFQYDQQLLMLLENQRFVAFTHGQNE
jgi:hypothetical protein